MSRTFRVALRGYVYHLIIRCVGLKQLFIDDNNFLAFERAIAETLPIRAMWTLGNCPIPIDEMQIEVVRRICNRGTPNSSE